MGGTLEPTPAGGGGPPAVAFPPSPLDENEDEMGGEPGMMAPEGGASDDQPPMEDCAEPPPRRCRRWHDPDDGLVHANVVGVGQLPDDVKARLPEWIPARTVPFLPEVVPSSTGAEGGAGGPCCICPQCGLSFYTPNDYWTHIPTCVVGLPPCVQNEKCLGDSHFDADPRVCMCRPGFASSSPAPGASGSSSTGSVVPPAGTSSSSSSSG